MAARPALTDPSVRGHKTPPESVMIVNPPVERRRRIGESAVVGDVVIGYAVDIYAGKVRTQRTCRAKSDDSYINDVVAETPSIRPAAWNKSAIAERILKIALQNVAAEH